MKTTSQLRDWVGAKMQDAGLSYSSMSKITGVSWQTFQKLMNGTTQEINEDTEVALCRLFKETPDGLRAIASGEKRVNSAKHDSISRDAECVWRWLNHDPARCAALRAMGYKGELPK